MAEEISSVVKGWILQDKAELSLEDVSRFCTVRQDQIVALVQGGILEPAGGTPELWRFPAEALSRAVRALRIQRDLELELAAVAVVLDLVDEIAGLRAELRRSRRSKL